MECIRVGDVADMLPHARMPDASVLEKPAETSAQSFFSEIVASISDIKSTSDGRYIVSRDYMTLKLWDVNMEARPVKTINVHEHLRPQVIQTSPNSTLTTVRYARVAKTNPLRPALLTAAIHRYLICEIACEEYRITHFSTISQCGSTAVRSTVEKLVLRAQNKCLSRRNATWPTIST